MKIAFCLIAVLVFVGCSEEKEQTTVSAGDKFSAKELLDSMFSEAYAVRVYFYEPDTLDASIVTQEFVHFAKEKDIVAVSEYFTDTLVKGKYNCDRYGMIQLIMPGDLIEMEFDLSEGCEHARFYNEDSLLTVMLSDKGIEELGDLCVRGPICEVGK